MDQKKKKEKNVNGGGEIGHKAREHALLVRKLPELPRNCQKIPELSPANHGSLSTIKRNNSMLVKSAEVFQ